jgi:hypothetical protein
VSTSQSTEISKTNESKGGGLQDNIIIYILIFITVIYFLY